MRIRLLPVENGQSANDDLSVSTLDEPRRLRLPQERALAEGVFELRTQLDELEQELAGRERELAAFRELHELLEQPAEDEALRLAATALEHVLQSRKLKCRRDEAGLLWLGDPPSDDPPPADRPPALILARTVSDAELVQAIVDASPVRASARKLSTQAPVLLVVMLSGATPDSPRSISQDAAEEARRFRTLVMRGFDL